MAKKKNYRKSHSYPVYQAVTASGATVATLNLKQNKRVQSRYKTLSHGQKVRAHTRSLGAAWATGGSNFAAEYSLAKSIDRFADKNAYRQMQHRKAGASAGARRSSGVSGARRGGGAGRRQRRDRRGRFA